MTTADTDPPPQQADAGPRRWAWLVLLTSSTTLLCCALPILLVTLGLGPVAAWLFASLPFLAATVSYKHWLFGLSALVLLLAGWTLYRPDRSCPADPRLAALCRAAERWNRRILLMATLVWTMGFAAAYLALPLYRWLEAG